MPLAFHLDRSVKFRQQHLNARDHIVPYVEEVLDLGGKRVLEIGCGEGGVLQAFLDRGCRCVGVDLSAAKIEFANDHMAAEVEAGRIEFVSRDVYDADVRERFHRAFDLLILKDTIEHIYDHERLLRLIRDFLSPGGVLFVAFPPWRMPFGGHQQMAGSRLAKLPYYHMLPRPVYRGLLRAFGETDEQVGVLMEIVDTRLSIRRFETLIGRCGYRTLRRRFYLINPIYEHKFGLKPVRQLPVLRSLPWIRDFVTTTCYYLIQPDVR
jgi:SAM-dependent methyltransferase